MDAENPRPPRIGILILMILVGLVTLKVFRASETFNLDQKPGKHRGDISLTAEDLPDAIGNWLRVDHVPPPPLSSLPDRQSWISHTWIFQTDQLAATVAFDQALFYEWHELTVCYEGAGWTVASRSVETLEGGDEWACVVAELTKPPDQRATLLFSGDCTQNHDLRFAEAGADPTSWMTELRLETTAGMKARRVRFQCVFAPTRMESERGELKSFVDRHRDACDPCRRCQCATRPGDHFS